MRWTDAGDRMNTGDLDAMIATFHRPGYDLVAMGV
jgi:hypothetical protein